MIYNDIMALLVAPYRGVVKAVLETPPFGKN